jgi:hypothetical protein
MLVELIIEDEERHHALMARLAQEAREAEEADGNTVVPQFSPGDVDRLLEPTERFLDAERDDRRRLRALASALKPLRDTNVWPLVIELMELDTRKHIRILEYLRARMREAR